MFNLGVWSECEPNDRVIKLARLADPSRCSEQSVQLSKLEIPSSQCMTLMAQSIRIIATFNTKRL